MKTYLVWLLLVVSVGKAQEFSISNLEVPMYSATGVLEQRLKAVSATGSVLRPVLKTGVIEFYVGTGKSISADAKLTFEDATYDHGTEMIEGSGRVHFGSTQGDITGVGFVYSAKTRVLTLKSQVVAHFQDAEIVGQTAEALVGKQSTGQDWAIEEALVRGEVVVTDFKHGKLQIDRAETQAVKYLLKTGLLVLSSPVALWREGKKSEISGSDDLRVPVAAPSAVPKQ